MERPRRGGPLLTYVMDLLVHVHRGIGGAQEAILGGAVFRIESNAHTSRTMHDVSFRGKGFVKTALQPMTDLFNLSPVPHLGQKHGKLVATKPGQDIEGTQLVLHPGRYFLEIQITDLVPVEVVHLLEVVEVDVNQSEDAGPLTNLLNGLIEGFFQRETVVDVGEQVELGAMD